jgi:hypothetical protein
VIRTPRRLKTFGFAAACASALLLLSGCGGGGGGGRTTPPPMGPSPPPPPQTVTVSGTVSFQRIGFNAGDGNGLNASSPFTSPARGIVVEALSEASRAVLGNTTTDANGAYSLTVPVNTMILVSAKAQMLKFDALPTWSVQVLNNANGDALYTLEGSAFSSGTTATTGRNLLAATGFDGTSYTGTRAAAPFAILDTIFQAQQLVVSANANTAFPALNIYWSGQNRATAMRFCVDTGDIGSSFYIRADLTDDCSLAPAGIYLLGAFDEGAGDTEEFDQHVIAHEFGHYIEDKFSRSDSIGGEHSVTDLLDLRVAFSEGSSSAVSAMTLNDPAYRDSFNGFANDFGFNLEHDFKPAPGWYSEASAGELIWDLFDGANAAEPFDTVAAGFTPIFAAMRGQQRTTDALTSVFSFLQAYKAGNPATSAAVTQLSMMQQIAGTDDLGSGETNDGGDPSVLPVYQRVVLNQAPLTACTNAANGDFNKLGSRKFFLLTLAANATVSIIAQATVDPGTPGSAPATDPDLFVFRRGVQVVSGEAMGPSETIPAQTLPAGTYVIEAFDFNASEFVPRCMNLTVTGS